MSPPRVQGLSQGLLFWSPFGAREQKLTITDYSDYTTLVNAFLAGGVDLPDVPIQSAELSLICSNLDVFCSNPASELGIFQLDLNHHNPFLGVSLQSNRTAPPPSFVLPASTASGCAAGFGQLTVNLQNQEQGNSAILDSFNKLSISNQPSGTPSVSVGDSGGSSPTGTYVFPCILSGTYKISSTVYGSNSSCAATAPTICITIGSGQSVTATLLVDWNSLSTKQPSQAGVYVGRALSHLVDKPSFVQSVFGSMATYDDEQVAPPQKVPNLFSNTAECADHPWFSPCNPVSAYNFVTDTIGGGLEWWTQPGQTFGVGLGYSGVSDLRAACEDFLRAGFSVAGGSNSTDCGDVALASQGTNVPTAYPHLVSNGQHVFLGLRTDLGRHQLGIILGDSINFLFGTPNDGCTVLYWGTSCSPSTPTFAQTFCIFFETCQWNLYTGGFNLNPVADQLYNDYYSAFASSFCGGQPTSGFLLDYPVYCDPQLDTFAAAGEFSPALAQSTQIFAEAAAVGDSNGMTVPAFTRLDQFAANNGWNFEQCNGVSCVNTQSSLVNVLGQGWNAGSGYWSLLNMRQVPGYNPCTPGSPSNCASFAPGGGDPELIRRGISQDTAELSPFQAVTTHEFEILSLIFDSMLHANPYTGGTDGQVVDWQTTRHFSTFNPTEIGCNTINGCVTGVTTQFWHLRNDLYFQDGTPVTANDVAYTITAYRDVPSSSFESYVASVVSAIGVDCGASQPCKTVQVKLQGQSALYDLNIGNLPIIPEHIWAPFCGNPPSPTSQCADPTFDPMAQGIMIGDGPWQCVVPAGFPNTGRVGGSCVVTHTNCPAGQTSCLGGQAMTTNDQMFLTRFAKFARCCPDDPSSSLYKISWADRDNNGVVNVLDLANIASRFGQADPYWVNSNIAPGPVVNVQDLATVAIYFGHGITYPMQPSQGIVLLDPQIDPFFCPIMGC